ASDVVATIGQRASFTFLLIFFFYGPRVPLDLLSFPTRRSSDLCCDSIIAVGSWLASARYAIGPNASSPSSLGAGSSSTSPPAMRDRKSTRLNSSHLGISYAVFCLKKKNDN